MTQSSAEPIQTETKTFQELGLDQELLDVLERVNFHTPTDIQTRNDGQRAFYIDDPDGNRIELCTVSGFGVLV